MRDGGTNQRSNDMCEDNDKPKRVDSGGDPNSDVVVHALVGQGSEGKT